MNYTIEIQNDKRYPIDEPRLKMAVATVLDQHEIDPKTSLTIVITDDDEVQTLNRTHRQIDAPTDVLSFPADPLPDHVTDEPPYIGDMIIAYPYTKSQADQLQHNLSDNLSLLVIHGTLHLLNYDHDTPENRAGMWSAQADALSALNIDASIVPTLEEANHD